MSSFCGNACLSRALCSFFGLVAHFTAGSLSLSALSCYSTSLIASSGFTATVSFFSEPMSVPRTVSQPFA